MRPTSLEADLLLPRERALPSGGRVRLRLEKESGIVGICGPSGSGKTTLIRALAGLPPRGTGMVRVDGVPWLDSARGLDLPLEERPVSYLPQGACLFPHMNVRENLLFAFSLSEPTRQTNGRSGSAALSGILRSLSGSRKGLLPERVTELVERFGIGGLLGKRTGELSGGQAMRVALARSFLKRARLCLLDEPLTGVDPEGRALLTREIAALLRERVAVAVWVTHTPGELSPVAEDMVVLLPEEGLSARFDREARQSTGFEAGFGREAPEWRR